MSVADRAPAAPGAQFAESSVEVDGFTIRYLEAGDGDTVVNLHGAGGLNPSFVHDALTESYRVILPELPGFGESPLNERTKDAADMASTVAAMLRALDVAPTHLWGTSLGAVVATHVAIEHPDVVRSLVLEAPGAFRRGARPPSEMGPQDIAAAFNRHPERVAYRGPLAPPDPQRWQLVMRIMNGEHDEALESKLDQIQAPTLAFWGIHDGIIPPEAGRIYKRSVTHCAYVLVDDAGHDVQGDRPEAVTTLVSDFLASGLNFVINQRDGRISP
jgi:pimeloyl-ACP methyl ester carboxylesterase